MVSARTRISARKVAEETARAEGYWNEPRPARKAAEDAAQDDTPTGSWPTGEPLPSEPVITKVRYGRGWSVFCFDHLRIMTPDEAVVMGFLFGWREYVWKQLPKKYQDTGWFYCTANTMAKFLQMGEDKQKRILRKFRAKGWIRTSQHRKPGGKGQPVRWVRLEDTKLVTDMETTYGMDWPG